METRPAANTTVGTIRTLAAVFLAAAFVYLIVHTIHWPMMLDAQVMHYVNFLIDHGFAPYRQILDMNMPGAYLMERFAMTFFGRGDLAFRVYDLFLMAAMTAGMIAIAWPYDWLAGLFPGVLFALIHASDGPRGTGQRDEVMAVLMVLGLAALLHAVRSSVPLWTALGGFFLGMATMVKPTIAPLGILLLLLAALDLRRSHTRVRPFILYGLFGAAIPAAIFFGYLLHYQALGAFLFLNRTLTAYYAHLNRMSAIALLRECMPRPMRFLVPFGLALALMNPDRRNWERWAIALSVAFAAISYFAQGKGFYYQRYPLIAFTLLWFSIEFGMALRRTRTAQVLGALGFAIGILVLVPLFAYRTRTVFFSNIFTETLEADLRAIGPLRLQHEVQCLDMVDGCMNALYHLNIVQQTGLTGDNLLFPPDPSFFAVQHYRQLFWDGLIAHPPSVFVLSDEQFLDEASFDKLNRWPPFANYLATHYDLYTAHSFNITVAYRIYLRKGSFTDLKR
jgi:hypothetical protein